MSQRLGGWADNFARSKEDLIHEIEIIHGRENAAAEGVARVHARNESLQKQLTQQYRLYAVATQQIGEQEARIKQLQTELESVVNGRETTESARRSYQAQAESTIFQSRFTLNLLRNHYRELAQGVRGNTARRQLRQLIDDQGVLAHDDRVVQGPEA